MNLVSFLSFHVCISKKWPPKYYENFDANALPQKQPNDHIRRLPLQNPCFGCQPSGVFIYVTFELLRDGFSWDSSMDSGILKPLPECLAKTFCRRTQSVCLVGHTDSGGWILVNMALFLHNWRMIRNQNTYSSSKTTIPKATFRKNHAHFESGCLSPSIFGGGDITHNLLEKSNFQNHHHSLPPWLPQLGLEVWDLIFCQKTANCVCGMRGPTKSSKTSYPNSSRCWVQVTCFKKYESNWIKSDHIPVFQINIFLKPHSRFSRHHFRRWFVWVWSLSFWNTPDTVQWKPLCHATFYQLVHKAPF